MGLHVNLPTYLDTIAEANSPYGTDTGSRTYRSYPPTAASIFNRFPQLEQNGQHKTIQETSTSPSAISRNSDLHSNQGSNSAFPPNSESDSPYYPLGSEASIRPTTPRFIIEEVSSANYEPILITGAQGK